MKFNFQVRTKEGELQTGIVEAPSKEAALALLQKYGFYVTFLKEKALPFYAKKIRFFGRASKKDLVLFARQIAVMFRSRVPLIEALETLANQVKKTDFKEKILKIKEEVEGGIAFSVALSRHPNLFSVLFIAIVKSGEATGRLSESLEYLADHLEREYEMTGKIKGAMVYPAFILFCALIIMVLMVTFVLPQLTTLLKESGQELPVLTRFIIGFSDFVKARGVILLLFFFGIITSFFWYIKTQKGKKIFDRVSLNIPIIGEFLKKIYLSRLAESLSTLISSGLPIARALEISAEVVSNSVYQNIISKTESEVKKGESISSILSAHQTYFPPVFTQMVLVGEKTGTLDSILMNVVSFYRKEIERTIDSILGLIEPVLIALLGLVVAIFAVAVITPVYQMMGTSG